jgi:hypothetical protein
MSRVHTPHPDKTTTGEKAMRDIRDKLTDLIRQRIEEAPGLEMVTSAGKPTPNGGYDTTLIYAQRGTATELTLHAAWFPDSAVFDLTGLVIERVPAEQRAALKIAKADYKPLGRHVFLLFADGPAIDTLLALITRLLAPEDIS